MNRRMMVGVSAMAAAAAAAALATRPALGQPYRGPIPVDKPDDPPDMSRQRKRYLQRQARKAQRNHRK